MSHKQITLYKEMIHKKYDDAPMHPEDYCATECPYMKDNVCLYQMKNKDYICFMDMMEANDVI